MWENWRREEQSFRRENLIGIGLGLGQGVLWERHFESHINLQHIPIPTVLMQCQRGLGNWSGREFYVEGIFMPNYILS